MSNWIVPPLWVGETAIILAGGPSLAGFLVWELRDRARIITINDSYRMAPWADVLYFCDATWYRKNQFNIQDTFTGRYMVSITKEDLSGVKRLHCSGGLGLDPDPGSLRHGNNSGYQAIHLAYHFGATRIILLGYDMQLTGQQTHWHQRDVGRDTNDFAHTLQYDMLPAFETLKEPLAQAGITVINSTPGSALKTWPFQPILTALNGHGLYS